MKGNKSRRVSNLLKQLSKILKIDKTKIFFDEKNQQLGHYIKNPNSYKLDKGKTLKYHEKHSFLENIVKLTNIIKNEKGSNAHAN